MAHKTCHDKQVAYEQTPEYKVEQAQKAVEYAEQRVEVTKYELEVARLKLKQILASVQ